MSYCILCHEPIKQEVSWHDLVFKVAQQKVCSACHESFAYIEGDVCKVCGRPLAELANKYKHGDSCYDCIRWEEDIRWQGVLMKNRSVYLYNDFMKEKLNLFKFRGDFIIAHAFKQPIQACYNKHFNENDYIVPIPLSEERLYERGFNQAMALASLLELPILKPLSRTHHEKQSKKSRMERLQSTNVFTMNEAHRNELNNKCILIIDDIYTTGSTVRHAAEVLRQAGAKSVSSLTLVRG
ncbi:ComF family protein [Cytobacillus sp. Hm23]